MIYLFIPKYLQKRKYIWFGVYSFFVFLFTSFCLLLFLILSIGYIKNFKVENLPPMSRNYAYLIILVYLVVAVVSFVTLWKENKNLKHKILIAQYKSKEQELTNLKNQIHPHFLFNSLNTIYGLALKQSSETPSVILKLSNLLDYILYQTNKPAVPLINEITHLNQYIELENARFKDTLKVDFVQNVENNHLLIAPMLLLPFVENAFKHGCIIKGFLKIAIDLSTKNNILLFTIENTYKPKPTNQGLGLKNIQERLDILYPNQYDLQIDTAMHIFKVSLKINLTKKANEYN